MISCKVLVSYAIIETIRIYHNTALANKKMTQPSSQPCPCLSGGAFSSCCAPYLSGEKTPDTPEKLMRSRYTAFTKADVDYLKKTASGKAQLLNQKFLDVTR
jgi:uncharacterized protein YchJ